MIYKHKNLHFSTPNLSTLRIDHDPATTQLEASGCSWGDTVSVGALLALCTTGNTHHDFQPTSAIREVL